MKALMIASGFGKSPFVYKGSGLYQIHLVKADSIRPFIPKELTLDETLGYTLGGFYLGSYEDSSFGAFNELVVIAGTVKSGSSPSRAWNAKVLISSDEVRDYAQKELGVLSQAANFSKKTKALIHQQRHDRKKGGFLNINGLGNCKSYNHIQITEMKDQQPTHSCSITIKTAASAPHHLDLKRLFITPQIKLSLPCFSGLSEHIPHQLLEYTCQMETRVRVVGAAKVSEIESDKREELTRRVLQSKPFVTFEFNSMKMMVDSPALVFQRHLPT